MNWHPIQSVFLLRAQGFQDWLWLHHDPDQDKMIIEDDLMTYKALLSITL